MNNSVVFILGPTASGKTDLSLHVARHCSAEIISADSMQVYTGLTIGTAKIDFAVYPDVPHHLINSVDPSKEFSVYEYRERALACIADIQRRGKLPIVVGGSGLYVKALTDGIAPHPGQNEHIRETLRTRIATKGLAALYEQLQQVDPVAAAKIHVHDERRIIRALEIYEQSQVPPTEWKKQTTSLEELGYRMLLIGITWEREQLYARVNARVDDMLTKGLLAEVTALSYASLSKTTKQAVGYKELFMYLRGNCSYNEAVSLIKQNTRHLVKKQVTWFRKEKRIEWFTFTSQTMVEEMCSRVVNRIQQWLSENNT